MTQYILQAHRNEIDDGKFYHTGYDLITINDNGTRTIQSLDLARVEAQGMDIGNIKIEYKEPVTAKPYAVDGNIIWWGDLSDDNAKKYNGDVGEYLNDKDAKTLKLLENDKALDAFNKMKADMLVRNSLDQIGLIDYDLFGPNCNTWTNHMDKEYIQDSRPGQKVLDELVDGILDKPWLVGEDKDFSTDNGYKDNEKAKIIDKAVDAITKNNPSIDPDTFLDNIKWNDNIGSPAGPVLTFSDDNNDYTVFKNGGLVFDAATGIAKIATGDWTLGDLWDLGKTLADLGRPWSPGTYDTTKKPRRQYCLPEDFLDEMNKGVGKAATTQSPLILDLNGDGVKTTSIFDGSVYFDHDGNGFAEKTGWVSTDDGLLVRDINGNGLIDNGSELFGSNTLLSNLYMNNFNLGECQC